MKPTLFILLALAIACGGRDQDCPQRTPHEPPTLAPTGGLGGLGGQGGAPTQADPEPQPEPAPGDPCWLCPLGGFGGVAGMPLAR